ncbi:MAG: LamG domain-containing protein [Bacteroidales bacterium]|nr:LamG domain-containing protein [Bacteroidales bacterium]
MKKIIFKSAFIACVSLIFLSSAFTGCKKDEVEPADTTKLTALIDSCQELSDAATTDDYPQAAITTFNTILATAKAAVLNTAITQTAVDNLVIQLREAKEVFLAAAYDAIPASSLIMGLNFDEGTGTQLTTAGKPWTAVLKSGPSEIFGTATNLPTFKDGKVGKAMYFNNGSHLEISNYTASDLMGKQLSISVWVNPDSTRAGNYIMSYNYWNSWKFQLQEQNKPFFTIHTNADGWVDADNQADFSAPNKVWTHLVVTLNMDTKILTFYVNGVSTMEWTATTKPGLTGTGAWQYKNTLPLMIGACTTYAEAKAEWNWAWSETPKAWDNFVGSMDELKLYNIALTDGQVAKLYKEESN